MKKTLLFLFVLASYQISAQCDEAVVFANDSTNAVCIEADAKVQTIYTNNLPNHSYGTWPSNNPVDAQELTFHMCAFPQKADSYTSIYDGGDFMGGCSPYIEFGVGTNGIRMAPYGARWFVNPNTQEENRDWNVEALVLFNMDFNNSHSNSGGQYHYHGIPYSYFLDSLGIDGSEHSPIVGYAADGFPIYYKYAYEDATNPNSGIEAFSSGYSLKSGNRPGDGITAPDGPYDGLYVEDYEFTQSNGPLDACNGRFGVTPDFPEGSYYYVMTDNWPYIPRCFYGTVIDNTFRIGPNCPDSEAEMDCTEEIVGIWEAMKEINLSISPNPASSEVHIAGLEAVKQSIDPIRVSLYDAQGKMHFLSEKYVEFIDVSSFPLGSYYIQVSWGDTQVTKKIMIQ